MNPHGLRLFLGSYIRHNLIQRRCEIVGRIEVAHGIPCTRIHQIPAERDLAGNNIQQRRVGICAGSIVWAPTKCTNVVQLLG